MKLHFTRTNGPADEAIDKLIELSDGIRRPEYVREMILAALKAGQEDDDSADLKLMNTTLKEMRFTADVLYLLENENLREGFFPTTESPVSVEPARADD